MKYRRFGRTELQIPLFSCGKMRYNLLGNGGHWFPGKPAKDVNRRSLLQVLRDSPHAQIIPDLLQETHQLLGGRDVQRLSQG